MDLVAHMVAIRARGALSQRQDTSTKAANPSTKERQKVEAVKLTME
jgi:hypothetical protein